MVMSIMMTYYCASAVWGTSNVFFLNDVSFEAHFVPFETPGQPALDLGHYLLWEIGKVTQKSVSNANVT